VSDLRQGCDSRTRADEKQHSSLLPLPLINSSHSMKPDMMFGWKPTATAQGAPIPLYYEYEPISIPINPLTNEEFEVLYYGPRPKNSLEMHKLFSNLKTQRGTSYPFKFPANMAQLQQ